MFSLILVLLVAIIPWIWKYAFALSDMPYEKNGKAGFPPKYKYHWLAKIILLLDFISILFSFFYILTFIEILEPCCMPTKTPTPTVMVTPTATQTTTTATVLPTITPSLTVTSTFTPTHTSSPSPTNTPVTPPPSADLQITNTDSATNYDANVTSVQYIIVVSNAGPNAVTGATVTDTSSANLTSVTWTCVGSGGASCTASGAGDINDSVNLPVGTSITYAVNATVVGASGPLVNTATVSSPAGMTDPTPSNNSATDTDQVIAAASFLPQLTTNGDGLILNISTSSFLDLQLPSSLSSTSQVIYYPDPTAPPPPLQIDVVILQLGDGKNWYTILNWGDGVPDANTDIPAAPACVASETDNCAIDPTLLTNSPGITIDLSGLPVGITYSYIRIKSPSNPPDSGDGVSIDAIVVVP